MTDFQTEQSPKEGQGKAVSGSIVTCVSVMLALILSDLYPDFFKQMKDNGYPLAVIAGVLAGMIAYIIIWWTSKSLVSRIIEFILDLKRIAKVWQSPLPPT